jgi:hypothetical protein
MSLLAKVSKGKLKKPHLVLIYGADGVGKSSFASGFPNSIFLGAEDGTNNLDVSRFPSLNDWNEVTKAVSELTTEKHDYQTLVIDSLDWLEPMLHKSICERYNVKSIELAAGGYGKGYTEALNGWIALKDQLSGLREKRQMNIVLIGHAEIIPFNDPDAQTTYDRYQLKLHKKASAMWREYVDHVLFANFEIYAKKDGNKTRAYGEGARVLYTERRPGFDAKNRLGLQFSLPLSYDDFSKSCELAGDGNAEKLKEAIMVMVAELKDADLKQKVVETVNKAGKNLQQLEAIQNRLRIRLED